MDNIVEKIQKIQVSEGLGFKSNESAILAAYKKQKDEKSNIAIKILTIFGGILATIAFMVFLFITGLFNDEMSFLLTGIIFIVSAVWLNKVYDKIIIDTFTVSLYGVGLFLFAFGLSDSMFQEETTTLIIMVVALITLFTIQNYIFAFISVLIINGGLLFLIAENRVYNLVHLYILFNTSLFTYWMLHEAKILYSGKKLAKLYNPVRIGLLVSLLAGLAWVGKKHVLDTSIDYLWFSSIIYITEVIYLVTIILDILNIKEQSTRTQIYVGCLFILSATIFAPAISGAIAILLLSFLTNYKTGLVIGIAAITYFITQYYYDLHYTLLVKSGILFFSGLLFLLFYFFIQKMMSDEKI